MWIKICPADFLEFRHGHVRLNSSSCFNTNRCFKSACHYRSGYMTSSLAAMRATCDNSGLLFRGYLFLFQLGWFSFLHNWKHFWLCSNNILACAWCALILVNNNVIGESWKKVSYLSNSYCSCFREKPRSNHDEQSPYRWSRLFYYIVVINRNNLKIQMKIHLLWGQLHGWNISLRFEISSAKLGSIVYLYNYPNVLIQMNQKPRY